LEEEKMLSVSEKQYERIKRAVKLAAIFGTTVLMQDDKPDKELEEQVLFIRELNREINPE
jgi:hypothetical protein